MEPQEIVAYTDLPGYLSGVITSLRRQTSSLNEVEMTINGRPPESPVTDKDKVAKCLNSSIGIANMVTEKSAEASYVIGEMRDIIKGLLAFTGCDSDTETAAESCIDYSDFGRIGIQIGAIIELVSSLDNNNRSLAKILGRLGAWDEKIDNRLEGTDPSVFHEQSIAGLWTLIKMLEESTTLNLALVSGLSAIIGVVEMKGVKDY